MYLWHRVTSCDWNVCMHIYVYGEQNIVVVLVPRVDSDK